MRSPVSERRVTQGRGDADEISGQRTPQNIGAAPATGWSTQRRKAWRRRRGRRCCGNRARCAVPRRWEEGGAAGREVCGGSTRAGGGRRRAGWRWVAAATVVGGRALDLFVVVVGRAARWKFVYSSVGRAGRRDGWVFSFGSGWF
jgi:hypothetical protein